jgi:hypothetical protein
VRGFEILEQKEENVAKHNAKVTKTILRTRKYTYRGGKIGNAHKNMPHALQKEKGWAWSKSFELNRSYTLATSTLLVPSSEASREVT